MTETAHTEMVGLLDEERLALLDGDIARVAGLSDRKSALAQEIEAASPDREALHELATLCARNQDLLRAALDGTRSAARRMGQVKEVQASLTTYDAAGRKDRFDASPRSLERKA